MTKDKKQQLKFETHKVVEENRLFRKRIDELFSKKYRTSVRFEHTLVGEDGKAYINVDLTKIKTPFSAFSYDRRMDPEIYDYINNEVYFLRASIPVVINFDDGGKYSNELKEKIRKAVIRHYLLEYEDTRLEYKRNLFTGIVIFIIGIIFLLSYTILSITVFKNVDSVLYEIMCILSWVFMWESIDRFFFSGHERRVDVYNAGQLALAEVQFGKPQIPQPNKQKEDK